MAPVYVNTPAPNVPYFTPAQVPPAGTAVDPQPDGKPIPKLFQPLKIRGVEFQNRIWVSRVCCERNRTANLEYLLFDGVVITTLPVLCEEWYSHRMAHGAP
ncbi:hypothetical protein NM688_g1811 [Phlebia brevispora]|uniref:Uncharacterized protein n=1 Tax=Phlebia brevispora TaxID=194682 RepID=A0ACC1TA55_9APHY|nr:hypothetical protein NM688_g1811 [Phlebia brevispora]